MLTENYSQTCNSDADFKNLLGFFTNMTIIFTPIFLIFKILAILESWKDLEAPYNHLYTYYHYVLQIPAKTTLHQLEWLFKYPFTIYPNLNLLIRVLIVITTLILLISLLNRFLKLLHLNWVQFILLLLSPIILGGVYQWLFDLPNKL